MRAERTGRRNGNSYFDLPVREPNTGPRLLDTPRVGNPPLPTTATWAVRPARKGTQAVQEPTTTLATSNSRTMPTSKRTTPKSRKSAAASGKPRKGFTSEERAAMKERARELKAEGRTTKGDGEREVLAKIAEMSAPERAMATRLHALIKASAPTLSPRTWYGMPAYAKDGKVVCFFQSASKFKTRYATLGFSDAANLDDGAVWPTAYALGELTPAAEATIAALVRKAVS